jgi:hypothetical protein
MPRPKKASSRAKAQRSLSKHFKKPVIEVNTVDGEDSDYVHGLETDVSAGTESDSMQCSARLGEEAMENDDESTSENDETVKSSLRRLFGVFPPQTLSLNSKRYPTTKVGIH